MRKTLLQRGFALISALVVLALVTAVSVSMALTQQHGIDLTQGFIRNDQLRHHANAIQLWANGVLIRDMKTNNIDSEHDDWNLPLQGVAIDDGTVDARIVDQQGRFNLNNLVLAGSNGLVARNRFRRLLDQQEIKQDVTDAISDWLDADNELRFPGGAEDDFYLTLDEPYRAANRNFAHPSELLLVKGVTREIYLKLSPYIATLPPGSTINVNTAPAEILMTLSDSMDETGANAIIVMRSSNPFSVINGGASRSSNTSNEQASNTAQQRPAGNANAETVNNSSSQLPSATDERGELTAVEANRLYNEWTWSNMRRDRAQSNLNNTENQQTGNVVRNTNRNSGISPTSSIDNDSGQGTMPMMAFDTMPFVRNYQIDTTALGVSSSFFRVNSTIMQYGYYLDVEYIMQRDRARENVSVMYKSYNGEFHE